jgi:hypothetical protein
VYFYIIQAQLLHLTYAYTLVTLQRRIRRGYTITNKLAIVSTVLQLHPELEKDRETL